jgi:DNA invertase Pin-like site-specific DNA recombinase
MSRRAALYLRVSTLDQNTDNQEIQLREAAGRAGYEITKVYRDHGISGAKGREISDPSSTRFARTLPDGSST